MLGFLTAIPRLVWDAIGIVALGLFLVLWLGCHDKRLLETAKINATVDSGATHIGVTKDSLRIRDSTRYHDVNTYHDVARTVAASHPGDTAVTHLVRACDQIVVSCADARKAAQTVIDSQDVQIKRYQSMKAATLPRLSFYGEALYSFSDKELVPRAGVDFRLFSGVSVTAAAQYNPHENTAQPFAGLRFTFR